MIWSGLRTFLKQIATIAEVDSVYVDGSFVTDKERFYSGLGPKDVDIVIEFPDFGTLNVLWLKHRAGLMNHDFVKSTFFVDLWLVDGPATHGHDYRKYFTYLRQTEALTRGLSIGTEKGILRISLNHEQQHRTV